MAWEARPGLKSVNHTAWSLTRLNGLGSPSGIESLLMGIPYELNMG